MRIKEVNSFKEIVDCVMDGKDIKYINFENDYIVDAVNMSVRELSCAIKDDTGVFVEVIDEN